MWDEDPNRSSTIHQTLGVVLHEKAARAEQEEQCEEPDGNGALERLECNGTTELACSLDIVRARAALRLSSTMHAMHAIESS